MASSCSQNPSPSCRQQECRCKVASKDGTEVAAKNVLTAKTEPALTKHAQNQPRKVEATKKVAEVVAKLFRRSTLPAAKSPAKEGAPLSAKGAKPRQADTESRAGQRPEFSKRPPRRTAKKLSRQLLENLLLEDGRTVLAEIYHQSSSSHG